MESFDRLQTERIVASRLRESDLKLLRQMDTDARIMKTLGGIRSKDATVAYLRNNLMHWDEYGFGLWILRSPQDGAFMGRAAVRHVHIAGNDEIEIGYALLPEYWGKGLATEIASKMAHTAFSGLLASDLVAFTLPDNLASRRVIEKIGGKFEKETTYQKYPHLLYRIEPPGGP
jgi:ribosomal-protein-alanine N-acetyltransferase